MSKYVDIDPIIDAVYKKWSGDPAYFANDTPTGIEARRDAELIELLRSKPSIDIVRCEKCRFHKSIKTSSGYLSFCRKHRLIDELSYDDFCSCGERRQANE